MVRSEAVITDEVEVRGDLEAATALTDSLGQRFASPLDLVHP